MSQQFPTVQELYNLQRDLADFAEFLNTVDVKDITTRLGKVMPSLKKIVDEVRRSNSAYSFQTLAALNAAGTPQTISGDDDNNVDIMCRVWNDSIAGNNGLYGWDGAQWVRATYDPLSAVADLADELATVNTATRAYTRSHVNAQGISSAEDRFLSILRDTGLLRNDNIVAAMADPSGHAPLALTDSGKVLIQSLRALGIEVGDADGFDMTTGTVNYDVVVVDEAGHVGMGLLSGEWLAGEAQENALAASLPFADGSQLAVGEFNYTYAVADENGYVLHGVLDGEYLEGEEPDTLPSPVLELGDAGQIEAGEFNYTFAIADEQGNVLQGYIDGTYYGPQSTTTANDDSASLTLRNADNVAWSRSRMQAWDNVAAVPGYQCNLFVFYGQSLMVGHEGWPALSTTAVPGNYMLGDAVRPKVRDNDSYVPFGTSQLQPLVETVQSGQNLLDDQAVAALTPGDGAYGESVCSGTLNLLRRRLLQHLTVLSLPDRDFVALNVAVSGKTIEQLSKNNTQDATVRYNRFVDGVSQVKALADAQGQTPGVAAIYWMQGEFNYTDHGGSVNYSDYLAALVQLHGDMVADAMQLTGQADPPSFFLYQTGANYTRDNDANGVAGLHVGMAQWDFSRAASNRYLVGPVYPYTDKGGHLDANGYRWYGQMLGKISHQVMVQRQGWEPLSPRRITADGDVILIDFHVPCPPLQFKQPYVLSTATDYPNKGFRITDAQGTVPILSVDIVASTVVKLHLSRELTTDGHLWYADKTTHEGNGCLCDSDPSTGTEVYDYLSGSGMYPEANIAALVGKPYPLENWCIAFYLPVDWERP